MEASSGASANKKRKGRGEATPPPPLAPGRRAATKAVQHAISRRRGSPTASPNALARAEAELAAAKAAIAAKLEQFEGHCYWCLEGDCPHDPDMCTCKPKPDMRDLPTSRSSVVRIAKGVGAERRGSAQR